MFASSDDHLDTRPQDAVHVVLRVWSPSWRLATSTPRTAHGYARLAAREGRGEECALAARAFELLGAGARQSLARRRANLEDGRERSDERTKCERDAHMRLMWLSGVL